MGLFKQHTLFRSSQITKLEGQGPNLRAIYHTPDFPMELLPDAAMGENKKNIYIKKRRRKPAREERCKPCQPHNRDDFISSTVC